ncbi:MAG: amidohydrolase [Pigmentiphaga sp.]|uniref:amidohydrolase n=1 Tax=Pigmentiphaga sp. TaxID=1977564 RepID=UPI0029A55FF6|nr:amidohydrolase [Pigmentiphaga sp.]MDX3907472.1 amidohydrolase [Pigmentiphaga sp.]
MSSPVNPGRGDDVVMRGGRVLTMAQSSHASALAFSGGRLTAVGSDRDVSARIGPSTRVIELAGRTVMPGMTDGHAHMDREGLKGLLPSVSGCRSIAELVDRLREVAAATPRGQWIVTMPLGEPPEYRWSPEMYAEGRLPDRHDLDRATGDHPLWIRCAWGYWPGAAPLVSVANTAALRLAGVGADTASPSPRLRIEKDAAGEPTGRFYEDSLQPLAEFTIFRLAPHFNEHDRLRTLAASMEAYNRYGTTAVFEGHGAAPELIRAYRSVRAAGKPSVRVRLVFSPGWNQASGEDIRSWVREHARRLGGKGEGDEWLRLEGLFAEPQTHPEDARLRAACAPQTGWAGFRYDCGLPPDKVRVLLEEAARARLRVCAIQTGMADVFIDVAKRVPIDGLRWVVAHPATLDQRQIAGIREHGMVVTTLTGAYIWRRAAATLRRVGKEREDTLCPIRSLLDAGVPVALASDNLPVSLWNTVWHAVSRIDRETGTVIAPGQRISREAALRCATVHGAWLCLDEHERGTLEAGKLADLLVLPEDPLSMPEERLAQVVPDETWVGGRRVFPH